jgi:uncharacterized protein YoxC
LIVIAAILTGVLIPAIVQFQLAMRSIQKLVRDNERDVHVAVLELNRLTGHINRVGAMVEANNQKVQSFFNSLEDVGNTVRKLRSAIRVASLLGAAVGPALASAVKNASHNQVRTPDGPLNGETRDSKEGEEIRR